MNQIAPQTNSAIPLPKMAMQDRAGEDRGQWTAVLVRALNVENKAKTGVEAGCHDTPTSLFYARFNEIRA